MKKNYIIGLVCLFLALGGVVSYDHGNQVLGDNQMFVISHSEYWSSEQGMIIGRLLDFQGNPITVTNCTVDIYYPNMSLFVNDGVADDSLQASTGTHFYQFITPSVEGVYQYIMTCDYPPNKQMSVANSFHLSPALNTVKNLNMSFAQFVAQELSHYNSLQANISVINSDLLVIKTDLSDIKVNLTSISADTTYIRSNMLTANVFNSNITTVINNQNTIIGQGQSILNNLTAIENFCGSATTSGSQLCLWVNQIQSQVGSLNTTMTSYTGILNEINQTTHSTYDYMTGTLATNINSIISALGRVETNTVQINATVNDIKANQEAQVIMEVTS
jgi:hypothetical protein